MVSFSKFLLGTIFSLSLLFPGMTAAQNDIEIKVEHLNGNIYALFGAGGNIGMSAGNEGVFLIDDQFAPLTSKILAAIREINDGPVQYVLNTHWHGDHTGGNENLGNEGAVIIAHDNVRVRMTKGIDRGNGRVAPPAAEGALPVLTFNDQASIFINGEEARAIHVKNAHTEGDSIVYFKESNVIHMGDTFFNELFPFIDIVSGGTIDGTIVSAEVALSIADENTVIIPGHGTISDKAGLMDYHTMLSLTRNRVAEMKAEGKSLDEIISADPTADYNDKWSWNFVNAERFVTAVYNSLEE